MKKIHTGRFILVLVICAAGLGAVAAAIMRSFGIPSTASSAAFWGAAFTVGGILCVMVILNRLVHHGRFKWLQRE